MEPGATSGSDEDQPVGTHSARFAQARRLWQNSAVEKALVTADIECSIAHVRALGDGNIVSREIAKQVVAALEQVAAELEAGQAVLQQSDPDYASGIERRVAQLSGINADILRLGRSQEERLSTSIRIWLSTACAELGQMLLQMRRNLLQLAQRDNEAIMPGYVHMQPATPVLLADWWLATEARLARDFARLMDASSRICVLPQGASSQTAQAGLNIDRTLIARYLGFCGVVENAIDAVSDRDYLIEFAAFAATCGMHISQSASDLLLWSTHEYGFVRLPRTFDFRGEKLPLKRNVELLEILRSRPSAISGRLSECISELKGLPLSFSHDLQEPLPGILEVIDNLKFILELADSLFCALRFNTTRMSELATSDLNNVSNAIDFLIESEVPNDKAAKIADALLTYCRERNKQLYDLTLNEWVQFSPAFNEEIFQLLENSAGQQRYFAHGAESMRASQAVQAAAKAVDRDSQAMTNLAAKRLNCRDKKLTAAE